MNINQVITDSNYAINPTDSIRYTLDRMADLRLAQLPVVKNGLFLGSASYETLADLANTDQRIDRADIIYQQIYIYGTQHIFDAVLFFQIYQLDLLVVVDEQHTYLGAITPLELLNTLSQTMSIHQPGG